MNKKNEIVFNGIRHELTEDEILVLTFLLVDAEKLLLDESNIKYFNENRKQQILAAASSLKSLFTDELIHNIAAILSSLFADQNFVEQICDAASKEEKSKIPLSPFQ